MHDPILGIRLKLDRAKNEIESLKTDTQAFLDGHPYVVAPAYNAPRRELRIVVRPRKACDGMWGVRAGEVIHNLRSALDHLVWRLVIQNTGHPPARPRRSQFPIFRLRTGDDGYESRGLSCLDGVADAAKARIEALQPFATGEDEMSPLWWLCELSNFDKHRTLHVAGLLAKSLTITERNFAPGISYDIFGSTRPFIRDTPFVVMLRFLGTEWPFTVPVEQVKMDGPLEVDIVFDDGVPKVAVGAPLVATLNSIGGRVYDAIEGVSGEFLGTKLSEP